MRKAVKIVLAVIVIAFITVAAFGSEFSIVVPSRVNQETSQEALAVDTGETRLTAELKEAMATTAPNEEINIWVEFDADEYGRRTNSSVLSLMQYRNSGIGKYWNNKKSELLPEEIIAVMFFYGKGVESPLKEGAKFGSPWYFTGMASSEINSIVDFPGVQEIDLRTSPKYDGKAVSILMELIAKTAKEYPTYKIRAFVEVRAQPNPETGGLSRNFESANQIILKYGGQVFDQYEWSHDFEALIPPSFELVAELSSLGEVASVFPNWHSHPID